MKDIANLIIASAQGGSEGILGTIDALIDRGEIDSTIFAENEYEILGLVDNEIFECECCGWTLEVACRSKKGEYCEDCED